MKSPQITRFVASAHQKYYLRANQPVLGVHHRDVLDLGQVAAKAYQICWRERDGTTRCLGRGGRTAVQQRRQADTMTLFGLLGGADAEFGCAAV